MAGPAEAEFHLDLQILEYALVADSREGATYFAIEGRVRLVEAQSGRFLWSRRLREREVLDASVFGLPAAVGNVVTARALSRLSEELVLWTSPRFGFVRLPDAYCTGSSIMPQKKNPDVPELLRGKSGRVFGSLTALLTLMKGQPLAYNKDNQEDKEPLFDAVDTLKACLSVCAGLVRGMQPVARAMRAAALEGHATATDLADYLVRKGVAFRDAHEIVGSLVRKLVREGRSFEALNAEEWRAHSELFGPDVVEWVTPASSVGRKRTPQSTHPSMVTAALEEARRWVSSHS